MSGLSEFSPESAIDRAAYPGRVVGVGKQMFQFDFAETTDSIAAHLLQTHRLKVKKKQKNTRTKMSNFYFCSMKILVIWIKLTSVLLSGTVVT